MVRFATGLNSHAAAESGTGTLHVCVTCCAVPASAKHLLNPRLSPYSELNPCSAYTLTRSRPPHPQMFYDDLPIWGFIGKIEKILHPGDRTEYKYYLFTHIHFDILYNGNRVIEVRTPSPSPCLKTHLQPRSISRG